MAGIKKTEEAGLKNGETFNGGYYAVEELRESLDTVAAVFAGTKAANGWKSGRQVTEAEYIQAVERFETSAAGRR